MLGSRTSIVGLLALLAATPAGAQRAVDGPQFWAVTGVASWDSLNLRVAPNADSRRVARIPHNARGLKNFGCPNYVTFEQWKRMTQAQKDRAQRSRWCEVEYNGKRGWVASRFLREDNGN
jgi:uncharacterized protein YgiM (DUF1202 family)